MFFMMNGSVESTTGDEVDSSIGGYFTTGDAVVEEENMDNVSLLSPSSFLNESIEASWDTEFRDSTRFWVQHVLVPVVMIVGVLGNIVTIFILTRRQMRTSSNVYLTALAVSDLAFLIFSFSMSWRHYECMKGIWIYWHYIPFGLWITDASSSTSVWLTVSFTIERYIAVCHPMTGKAYCTEKRAKYVAIFVYILCFLLTASTPFEWKSVVEVVAGNARISSSSINETVYILENTDLGKHQVYRLVYHWFTIIFFVTLPLFILAIVNVFLINAVRKSRMIREGMTNSHLHYQRRLQILKNEDRITITLIAVVIMFLICQVPTATILIYTAKNPATHGSAEENVLLGLGNIFNLLVAINAACNFLLYTALSDKYRRVFFNVLFVHTKCWGNRRRRERCRRVVYATPTHHLSRMNGNTNTIGLSNLRLVPPTVKVNGFISIQTPVACSSCGETRDPGTTTGACTPVPAAAVAPGEIQELKVLRVLRKGGTTSMERFYCSPVDSGTFTLTKEFQSI